MTRKVAADKLPLHGVLSTLLEWHEADPVNDWERRRNDRVFEIQGNQNPFVDREEWVGVEGGEIGQQKKHSLLEY